MTCQIISPVGNPVESETYHVGITGQAPLAWSWSITGGLGSDSGSSSSSPDVVDVAVPAGASGEKLKLKLNCAGGGQDSEEWVIASQ